MEQIQLEPYIYAPTIDSDGDYIDYYPQNHFIKCQCNGETHLYGKEGFRNHTTTVKHRGWLMHINNNRHNLFRENIRLNELVENQKSIIAKMDIEIQNAKIRENLLKDMMKEMQSPKSPKKSPKID